ncbi:MAG TPA: hypothetical protein VJY39_06780 [Acidisphaera sp.]|nr:hypothetical protein [Acidisphaera sp.]
MITTTGTGRQQAVRVDGGPPIAVLDHRKLSYTLNGKDYNVRRRGILSLVYELWRGDEMLACAQRGGLRERFTVTSAGKEWALDKEGIVGHRYGLFAGDQRVGEIKWAGRAFHMDVVADLPNDMPLETQVFLTWLALWRFGDTSD